MCLRLLVGGVRLSMGFLLSCEFSFFFPSLFCRLLRGCWVGRGVVWVWVLMCLFYRTTTELTARLSLGIARLLGLESVERVVEFVVRGVSETLILVGVEDQPSAVKLGELQTDMLTQSFFGLNLFFNGVVSCNHSLTLLFLALSNTPLDVDPLHTSPRQGKLDHAGLHHEHVVQLCHHCRARLRHLL